MRAVRIGFLMLLLAGCGGQSGIAPDRARTSAQLLGQASGLLAALSRENVSDPALLPTSGHAVYQGYSTINLPMDGTTVPYAGDLNLTVTFAPTPTPVVGSMRNFIGLEGQLLIGNGTIYRDADPDVDLTFDADLTGTLTKGGDSYALNGTVAGDFRGRTQSGVTGVVYGAITGPDGVDLFQGTLAATQ